MKILVTGGAGYIGSHTVVELLLNNYEVIIVDDFYNSSQEVLDNIKLITNKEFNFYNLDILDEEQFEKVFIENEIDGVIHFAAYKAVGESVEKPIEYYHNNLTGLLVLTKLMKKYSVKNFVFSSSATVYGMDNVSPLTEEMPTSATNPYGYTKVMSEQILKDIAVGEKDWSITLLRYFNPIGAHSSGLIGEKPNGIPNNLMPYITQVASGIREKLYIFGNDYNTVDGTGVRDYIHVVDIAKGHIKAFEKLFKMKKGIEVYNLGTGEGYSVLQLVKAFEEINGIKIPYEIVDRRAGDIGTCYANPSKANKYLDWEAKKKVEDMVEDAWNWEKSR